MTQATRIAVARSPETLETPPARRRWPTGTSTMRKPRGGGAHLHLQVPAEGLLAHAEAFERVAPDGAERRHVREAHAVAQADQKPGEMAGEDLGRRQAARLARAAQARAQHEVGLAPLDGREHGRDHLGPVAAVAVDEEHDRWRAGEMAAMPASSARP